MALHQEQHAFKGMQRDLTVSKFNPEYYFDAKNIRITAKENNTLFSISNEKGNLDMDFVDEITKSPITIKGYILGYTTIQDTVIIFTTDNSGGVKLDHIYKATYSSSVSEGRFEGADLLKSNTRDGLDLGFSETNPIEAIGLYENEYLQKVYWVDGKNQPRVINIKTDSADRGAWNTTSFDFSPEVKLTDEISVTTLDSVSGVFSSGVVQYAFTYVNYYGVETPIINTSGLNYVAYPSRGGSPESKLSVGFMISLRDLDINFEYIRLYAIHRASLDGPISARRITDIKMSVTGSIEYVDNGTRGDTIDATELLYKGGEELVAGTITNKDNVLFLGDLKLGRQPFSNELKTLLKSQAVFDFVSKSDSEFPSLEGFYPYKNSLYLGSFKIKHFKRREWYRFGIQFQYKNGFWSEVVHLKDAQLSEQYLLNEEDPSGEDTYYVASVKFPSYILNQVKSAGYSRARLAVVYPTSADREVVCQGILCPTVFNVEDRYNDTIFAQSSWFARPYPAFRSLESDKWSWRFKDGAPVKDSVGGIFNQTLKAVTPFRYTNTVSKGELPAYMSHTKLPDSINRNGEIQCNFTGDSSIGFQVNAFVDKLESEGDIISRLENSKDLFMVDASILTLHSPEIEFNDSIQNLESDSLKLRIVGLVNLTSFSSDLDIQVSTPVFSKNPVEGFGFYKEFVGVQNSSQHGGSIRISNPSWIDSFFGDKGTSDDLYNLVGYFVYPWHANRSLMNQSTTNDEYPTKHALLDKKKLSNLRFGGYNCLFKTAYNFEENGSKIKTGISGVRVWNSKETGIIRVPAPKYSGLPDFNYSGNIDKVITCPLVDINLKLDILCAENSCSEGSGIILNKKKVTINKKNGYPIIISNACRTNSDYHRTYISDPVPLVKGVTISDNWSGDVDPTINSYGIEPIRMKYKSTPHIVFSLNYTNEDGDIHVSRVLPNTMYYDGNKFVVNVFNSASPNNAYRFFWNKNKENTFEGISQDTIPSTTYYSNLVKNASLPYPYHGYSYLYIGELYNDNVPNRFGGDTEEAYQDNMWHPMPDKYILSGSSTGIVEMIAATGDTFYQRYDCLKTYPFTLEDQNSVVDIVSFKVETRINLDGRYDKNRGQLSNLVMTPENFNKMNPVYDQQDNFWTYRGLNTNKIVSSNFPGAITWTKEKIFGGDIDNWTQINLASILYLSGDKGVITSLKTFKNEIYAFQQTGLSHILYNSRVQVPTSDGVPIEISSGSKMGGSIYISEVIGCNNKWSIQETPSGLYFIDNDTNSIYLFNGQINNLSDRLGFRQWIGENNNINVWDPKYWDNFKTFYDWNNGDVYFTLSNTSLCFSEHLGQFTSFMDYGEVPAMFNIQDKFFTIKNNSRGGGVAKIWKQFAGDYNMFFGTPKPYSVTFISNAVSTADKIFNILEFRSDNWNGRSLVDRTFDTLNVWNEYQKGTAKLANKPGFPSSLKRKFRIWRALIPRDNKNKRDRIRNTWAYLKLSREDVSENRDRVELHDATVHYFA